MDGLSGLGFQPCKRSCLDSANIAHLEVYVRLVLTDSETWKVSLKQFSK